VDLGEGEVAAQVGQLVLDDGGADDGASAAQTGHSMSSNSMMATLAPAGGLRMEVSLKGKPAERLAFAGTMVWAPARTLTQRTRAAASIAFMAVEIPPRDCFHIRPWRLAHVIRRWVDF